MLFIIDDCVNRIKTLINDPRLGDLVSNRRHKFTDNRGVDCGTISIIFTT